MRHKCPENVKIAIKTLLCTYGFRDFSQKLKITTFAFFGGKFFSHGHFLQTPSSGAHEYILVQNISFFGIYQVQNLVYYQISNKKRFYEVSPISYNALIQLF